MPAGITKNLDHKVGSTIDHFGLIAKTIVAVKPDIVALQEVDRRATRSNNVDQAKVLAELVGMKFVFGPNIKLGKGGYGNAVLSRYPIKLRMNHKLPNVDNGEQRGVLDVDVVTPHDTVRVLATHFDHRRDDRERRASAEFVNKLLSADPKTPTLLVGDLNAVPTSRPVTTILKVWQRSHGDFPTVPVSKPKRQIDYVLVAPKERLAIVKSLVLDEATASDHRAILAIVNVTPKGSGARHQAKPLR